jgi:MFS transporter, ACS family, hexuronate transporter
MSKRTFWILTLLFASSVINYLDRQSLSILAATIQTELRLTDLDYAHIVQMFLLPYTLAFLLAGRITDWLRPRKAMAAFIILWSSANLCTAFVRTGLQLGLARFFLGLGEPGNWVAGPKAISDQVEIKNRPIALSITSAGATLGAAISPPVISFLAIDFGWRSAFFVTGALGLIWVIPWLLFYRDPILPAPQVQQERTNFKHEWKRWRDLIRVREVWLLAVVRMITDPVWYFYLFWFPKYLSDTRHLSLRELGKTAWVVYVAADAGSILSGFAVSRLIARGGSPVRSERRVMTVLACIAPVGALIPFTSHLDLVLLIAAMVAFAHLGWQMLCMTLAFNYFPPNIVATAWGIACAGSSLGALVSANLIGHTITSFSYMPVFCALAVLHPLGLILLWQIRANRAATITGSPRSTEAIVPA